MTNDSEHDLLDAFDKRWDEYRKQFKAGRREISEDSIHDLRVAARRMQALLSLVRALDARPRVKKISRLLRKQLDHLDVLRDTQVMVEETNSSVESLPQLISFRQYLQERLRYLGDDAQKYLRKRKPSELKQRVRKIRKVIKRHSEDAELVELLYQGIDGAHAKVMTRFGKLDAGDPNTIHRVRIAFKKLRYMIEVIQPFLPDYPANYPDRMHDYQDAMGKVHDTSVFLDALKDYEAGLKQRDPKKVQDLDLKPAEQYYRARLADLVSAYFQRKDELHSFWRAAPDQPFPWEKNHDPLHRTTRDRGTARAQQQRGERQPASSNRRRTKKVPADRAGAGQSGHPDRPDTDQSVPTGS